VINAATAYDKIPLINVLHFNIYLAFKIKKCSPLRKAVNGNVNIMSLFAKLAVASIQLISFGSGSQWIHCGTSLQRNILNRYNLSSLTLAELGNFQSFGLHLRNDGMYRQLEKKLVKQQYLLQTSSQYGKLRPPING